MADENNTGATSEVLATNAPADVPVVKKQRAPRRSKAAMEAASTASPATTTVKSPKVRAKRGAKVEATSAAVETPNAANVAIKGPRKAKATGQSKAPATKSVAAADEMADLIQLEEENKRLRKALADKLRAENADLRKRLGA
jgi:putative transposase